MDFKGENERDTGIRAIVLNEICELAKNIILKKLSCSVHAQEATTVQQAISIWQCQAEILRVLHLMLMKQPLPCLNMML